MNNQEQLLRDQKQEQDFRNYTDSPYQKRVAKTYQNQHTYQTYYYVREQHERYFGNGPKSEYEKRGSMDFWDIYKYLKTKKDDTDPDTDDVQMYHALQTAEALRSQFPNEKYKWLHLTGFFHDFGKLLGLWEKYDWAIAGDTFPVGCQFSEANIFYKYFQENPDFYNPNFKTKYGIYEPNCGFDNVMMAWGHDEYWAKIMDINREKHRMPKLSSYIVRYHSFYPWHQKQAYSHLASNLDKNNLKWLIAHQKCDLYSKSTADLYRIEENLPYYKGLVEEFFNNTMLKI